MTSFVKGFTLIELLVVISIIAILAVVGFVVFKGVLDNSRDSKRKADVDAIAKAYEVGYKTDIGYTIPGDGAFSGNAMPKDPSGTAYYNVAVEDPNNPGSGAAFRVCAALESYNGDTCNIPTANCYCVSSTQGNPNALVPGASPAPTPPGGGEYNDGGLGIGNGGNTNLTCDPDAVLALQLNNYWKLNDTASPAVDSAGGLNGVWTSFGTTGGLFGSAGSFNGSTSRIYISPFTPIDSVFTGNDSFSVAAWVKIDGSLPTINTRILYYGYNSLNGFNLVYNGANQKTFIFEVKKGGSTSSIGWNSLTKPSLNSWYMVVGVFDGTSSKLYIGNVSGSSFETTPTGGVLNMAVASTNGLSIGANLTGTPPNLTGGNWWKGVIDDVRVYSKALSEDDVKLLWNDSKGCVP